MSRNPIVDNGRVLNRLGFLIGMAPFIPFLVIALYFKDAQFLLGPIVGFVPVSFFHSRSATPPSAEQIHFWFWIAGIVYFFLAALGLFKKPFGLIYGLAVWGSTIALIVRIILRLNEGPLFE